MGDFALFLKCKANSGKGNFEDNVKPRKPDARFWDQVSVVGGVVTGAGKRSNADARKVELVAPSVGADRVYFAVDTSPAGATLLSISFMCGIHLSVRSNKATVASPFRDGGEIQCHLTSNAFTTIVSSTGDTYQAIGPYTVVKDPGAQPDDCVFHKLTVVASVRSGGSNHEFAYDPDMDIQIDL